MHANLAGRQSKGFTIVELVVVIILLGILAATALPRFVDLDEEAHTAAFDGVMAGFQTGVAMYHAQWMAEGQPIAGTQIIEFNNLRANADGWPYSTTSQTGNVVTNSEDCETIFVGVMQGGPSVSDAATAAAVTGSATDFTAVRNTTSCTFYYTGESNQSGATIQTFTYNSVNGIVSRGSATLT